MTYFRVRRCRRFAAHYLQMSACFSHFRLPINCWNCWPFRQVSLRLYPSITFLPIDFQILYVSACVSVFVCFIFKKRFMIEAASIGSSIKNRSERINFWKTTNRTHFTREIKQANYELILKWSLMNYVVLLYGRLKRESNWSGDNAKSNDERRKRDGKDIRAPLVNRKCHTRNHKRINSQWLNKVDKHDNGEE